MPAPRERRAVARVSWRGSTPNLRRPRGTTLSWLLRQAAVDGFDERGGRHEAILAHVFRVVVERGPRGLDLPQRHAVVDHGGDSIADDDHHIAKLDDVGLVAEPAVARDHE